MVLSHICKFSFSSSWTHLITLFSAANVNVSITYNHSKAVFSSIRNLSWTRNHPFSNKSSVDGQDLSPFNGSSPQAGYCLIRGIWKWPDLNRRVRTRCWRFWEPYFIFHHTSIWWMRGGSNSRLDISHINFYILSRYDIMRNFLNENCLLRFKLSFSLWSLVNSTQLHQSSYDTAFQILDISERWKLS